ncbi:MAG: hypothetical protein M3444_00510 [Acidobacteriota bacterium]|nr:hypothetical protein [Acidobacteriota bacterium]MDQ5837783.1 hypothetical protein [Acidobacteriota bacterium]
MHSLKAFALLTVCVGLAAVGLIPSEPTRGASTKAAPAAPSIPPDAWQIPFAPDNEGSPDQTEGDYYKFAWQSFIALNWPALSGRRGAPDTTKKIGDKGADGQLLPVVWDTFKGPSELFLPNAQTPGPWDSPPPAPPAYCTGLHPGEMVLSMAAKDEPGVLSDVNQAGFPQSAKMKLRGPVVDQSLNYVRYDIRLDRSEFQYFVDNKYYDQSVQKTAVRNTKQGKQPAFLFPPKGNEPWIQNLPPYARQGSIELKSAWRILDPRKDVVERYYHIPAYVADPAAKTCREVTVGLIGLHILRLTPKTGATWVWATFEQVDNVEVSAGVLPGPGGTPLAPSLNPGPNGKPKPPYFGGYYGKEPPPVLPNQPLPKPTAPNDISRLTPMSGDVQAVNRQYQSMLGGTVWQYYELVGSLNPYVKGAAGPQKYVVPHHSYPDSADPAYINTRDLANTSMEAYVQPTSCIVCHAYAVPWGATFICDPKGCSDVSKFQAFTFLLKYAQPPQAPPRAKRTD